MGFFSRAQQPPKLVDTELDVVWFGGWLDRVLAGQGRAKTDDAVADLCDKAVAVIDHDCSDYVKRYCDSRAQRQYDEFRASDACTPWALISLVVGLNPEPKWHGFIVEDMRAKLGRFAEILVDPSIVQ